MKAVLLLLALFATSLGAIEKIHFDEKGENKIGYFYIGGHEEAISEATWLYIKQGLSYYKKNRPIFIILELNTPGGEVFAAQKISDALRDFDLQENIPVVAFINDWAISAGAMLAYSCPLIATVPYGSMGAAEPVLPGADGKMESASEKVNSAIRTDFANRAAFFGRNSLIAEAMVDKDLILVKREGKIIKLDQESQIRLNEPNPDIVFSPKGKLLTLNGQEMIQEGVANFLVPAIKIEEITKEEKAEGVWPASKSLLFHIPEFAAIPNAVVHEYKMDWKTQLFVFLASPAVSSLLMMGLLVGGYMELSNPGLTLPGIVAATCLGLIILSRYGLELGYSLEWLMLLSGLLLLCFEVFIGSFGLIGIVGIILFFGALLLLFLPGLSSIPLDPSAVKWEGSGEYLLHQVSWFFGSILLSIVLAALIGRFLMPKFPFLNRFVLKGSEQESKKGFYAGEPFENMPAVGQEGRALSLLRPGGKILISDKIYDGIALNESISEGEKIVVKRVEGSTVFVARL